MPNLLTEDDFHTLTMMSNWYFNCEGPKYTRDGTGNIKFEKTVDGSFIDHANGLNYEKVESFKHDPTGFNAVLLQEDRYR
jgi:hypothetical protein